MVQLSKATDYAIRFLANLSLRPENKWSVGEASEELKISKRFLANIVHSLSKRKIITTTKGVGGGVKLSKNPKEISLLEIIEIFEGPISIMTCTTSPDECEHQPNCTIHPHWVRLKDKLRKDLEKMSILNIRE